MQKPFWTNLFSQRGSKRRGRKRGFHCHETRSLRLEPLEVRQLLAIDAGFGDELTVGYRVAGSVLVTDNDSPDAAMLSIGNARTTEGGDLLFTVTLSEPSDQPVTVRYQTMNATAKRSDADFGHTSGIVYFAPGMTHGMVAVATGDDRAEEGDEHLYVLLSNAKGAAIDVGLGTGVIIDNDSEPLIDVSDALVATGGEATFIVSLSNPYEQLVTVDYATANGTAREGKQFESVQGTFTFPPGQTAARLHVATFTDPSIKQDRSKDFTVVLSNPTNAVLDRATGTGTITARPTEEADPVPDGGDIIMMSGGTPPNITIDDPIGTEGYNNSVCFTVFLSEASDEPVSIWWSTSDGTAVAGDDYQSASYEMLEINAGEISGTIAIELVDDSVNEGDEHFSVNLATASYGVITDRDGEATIIDDDPEPSLSISSAQLDEYGGSMSFTVALSNPSGQEVTVSFETEDVTAMGWDDYEVQGGTIGFSPGETSQTISIGVINDDMDEPEEEAFLVRLTNPQNATIDGENGVGVGTIIDDDDPPSVTIDNMSAEENAGSIEFTVSLSHPSSFPIEIGWSTSPGTATEDVDYTGQSASATLEISPGETSGTISVELINDDMYEEDEDFQLTLSNPVNATILDGEATGTIENDDPMPSVSIEEVATAVESDGEISILATLSNPSYQTIWIYWEATEGTARHVDDYTDASGTLEISPGEVEGTITIGLTVDNMHEDTEDFYVSLTDPVYATIDSAYCQTTATITDDDPEPTISIDDASAYEDEGYIIFTLTLSNPTEDTVTVAYATGDAATAHLATADTDYQSASDSVTFAPGDTSKTISIALIDDDLDEPDEDFLVTLSDPQYATIYDVEGTGTILDDDLPAITIFASNAYARERDSDGPWDVEDIGAFTVCRGEWNTVGDLEVFYQIETSLTNAAAATINEDYTLSSASGSVTILHDESSAVIEVTPLQDTTKEWDELVVLTLTYVIPDEATINGAYDSATVTILDNDGIGGFVNRNADTESTGSTDETVSNGTIEVGVQEGHVRLAPWLQFDRFTPTYRGDDNLHPIVSVEMALPGDLDIPDEIKAVLTFGGISSSEVEFTNVGEITSTEETLRFVLLGDDLIAEALRTGHYDYDVVFTATFDLGGPGEETRTRTVRGSTEVFNLVDDTLGTTEFGKQRWVDDLDRLVPDDGNSARLVPQGLAAVGGMALMRGDNTSAWYVAPPDNFGTPKIVEDGGAGYLEPNGYWADGSHDGGAYRYLRGTDSSDYGEATWQFDELASDRQYQVFTTWVPDVHRTPSASYAVSGGDRLDTSRSSSPATIEIDQRFTPGEVLVNDMRWRSLGFYRPDSQGILTVTLTVGDLSENETAVADAVMLIEDWEYETPDGSFNTLEHGPLDTEIPDENYDPQPGDYTLLAKYGNRYEFDELGLLQYHVDRNGNMTRFEYEDRDSDDFIDELKTIQLQGDTNGTRTYTFGGTGSTATAKDFADRDITLESLLSPIQDLQFNTDGYLTSITDGKGNVTTIVYDSITHRVKTVTNADTHDWKLTPFLVDGLESDSEPDPLIRKPAAGTDVVPSGGGTFNEAKATYTDPRNNKWTYQTDHYGYLTAKANPAPYEDVWRWERDENGLTTKYIQPKGGGGAAAFAFEIQTTYDYDSHGNLTCITYPDDTGTPGQVKEQWEYDKDVNGSALDYTFSQVSKYTDQIGRTIEYQLDLDTGNVVMKTERGAGEQADFRRTKYEEYSARPQYPDQIGQLPGGLAVITETKYYESGSHVGLVEKVTYAKNENPYDVIYTYDTNRNPASVTKYGRKTAYIYDDRNRLTQVTEPAPGTGDHGRPTTVYDYNANNNRTSVTDARGATTTYKYL